MKGSANAAWITWDASLRSGERRHGDRAQNRRGGAPEGAPAGHAAGGAPSWGAQYDLRRFGAPPPSGRQRNPGESPEQRQGGLAIRANRRAERRTHASVSISTGDDDMKASKRKAAW